MSRSILWSVVASSVHKSFCERLPVGIVCRHVISKEQSRLTTISQNYQHEMQVSDNMRCMSGYWYTQQCLRVTKPALDGHVELGAVLLSINHRHRYGTSHVTSAGVRTLLGNCRSRDGVMWCMTPGGHVTSRCLAMFWPWPFDLHSLLPLILYYVSMVCIHRKVVG